MANSRNSGNVIGGLVIIAVGLWFLLNNFGFDLPGIGNFWPIFPTLGGLAFIVGYVTRRERDPGVLIPGVSAFLIGLFFFLFTLDIVEWSEMRYLWPVFPLVGGIAFVAAWLGGRGRDSGLLVPGIGGIAVGLIGLFFTATGLDASVFARLWPLFLIVIGIGMLLRNFLRR